MGEPKVNKPKDTDFIQQRLRAYQPIYTLESTVSVLVGLTIIFYIYGYVLYTNADRQLETSVRYDDHCNGTCSLEIIVEGTMTKPVFIFYEFKNFYQNHRNYVKSKSYEQLRDVSISQSSLATKCSGAYYGKDFDNLTYINGTLYAPDDIVNPCGLMAKSFFNDNFEIFNESLAFDIIQKDISWQSDREYLFEHPKGFENKTWIDVENEHFIV